MKHKYFYRFQVWNLAIIWMSGDSESAHQCSEDDENPRPCQQFSHTTSPTCSEHTDQKFEISVQELSHRTKHCKHILLQERKIALEKKGGFYQWRKVSILVV